MNDKYYIDAKSSALDSKFEARMADFDARIEKKLSSALKWVIAITLSGVVLNTSIMVAMLNRPQPAPIVQPPIVQPPIIIYAQPASGK